MNGSKKSNKSRFEYLGSNFIQEEVLFRVKNLAKLAGELLEIERLLNKTVAPAFEEIGGLTVYAVTGG
jgi:hypothetical protein